MANTDDVGRGGKWTQVKANQVELVGKFGNLAKVKAVGFSKPIETQKEKTSYAPASSSSGALMRMGELASERTVRDLNNLEQR